MFVTAGLNVRIGPDQSADVVAVLERGSQVAITGETNGTWSQVLMGGKTYWVSTEYLSKTEPTEEPDAI